MHTIIINIFISMLIMKLKLKHPSTGFFNKSSIKHFHRGGTGADHAEKRQVAQLISVNPRSPGHAVKSQAEKRQVASFIISVSVYRRHGHPHLVQVQHLAVDARIFFETANDKSLVTQQLRASPHERAGAPPAPRRFFCVAFGYIYIGYEAENELTSCLSSRP